MLPEICVCVQNLIFMLNNWSVGAFVTHRSTVIMSCRHVYTSSMGRTEHPFYTSLYWMFWWDNVQHVLLLQWQSPWEVGLRAARIPKTGWTHPIHLSVTYICGHLSALGLWLGAQHSFFSLVFCLHTWKYLVYLGEIEWGLFISNVRFFPALVVVVALGWVYWVFFWEGGLFGFLCVRGFLFVCFVGVFLLFLLFWFWFCLVCPLEDVKNKSVLMQEAESQSPCSWSQYSWNNQDELYKAMTLIRSKAVQHFSLRGISFTFLWTEVAQAHPDGCL